MTRLKAKLTESMTKFTNDFPKVTPDKIIKIFILILFVSEAICIFYGTYIDRWPITTSLIFGLIIPVLSIVVIGVMIDRGFNHSRLSIAGVCLFLLAYVCGIIITSLAFFCILVTYPDFTIRIDLMSWILDNPIAILFRIMNILVIVSGFLLTISTINGWRYWLREKPWKEVQPEGEATTPTQTQD